MEHVLGWATNTVATAMSVSFGGMRQLRIHSRQLLRLKPAPEKEVDAANYLKPSSCCSFLERRCRYYLCKYPCLFPCHGLLAHHDHRRAPHAHYDQCHAPALLPPAAITPPTRARDVERRGLRLSLELLVARVPRCWPGPPPPATRPRPPLPRPPREAVVFPIKQATLFQ